MKKIINYQVAVVALMALALLIAVALAPLQAFAANLLTNGGFEEPSVSNGGWGVFPSAQVPGWTVEWADNSGGGTLEFQNPPIAGISTTAEGEQYVELGSDGKADASVRVLQSVDTCQGGEYELTFSWQPRPAGLNTHLMNAYVDGALVGSYSTASDSYDAGEWNSESHTFNGTGGAVEIVFEEAGSADTLGMLLDEVVVTETSCPDVTPPAMPTGLDRYAPDEDARYACGDVSVIQTMHPDWDDNLEEDFSHYEYSSFNPTSQGIDERRFDESIFEYNGNWLPGLGTYGYSVRAVDLAGNKSPWALSGETLEGSCQITYVYPTTGEIIEPEADEVVSGMTDLVATYDDGDNLDEDAVNWAVRPYSPNCNGGGNLFGGGPQVSGIINPSLFTFDGKDFSATIDTTLIEDGKYCFVFNPTDDGPIDVRELVGFYVENDTDGDGVLNEDDNCELVSNPDQEDFDGDEFGDACDEDVDGDGVDNGLDLCPFTTEDDFEQWGDKKAKNRWMLDGSFEWITKGKAGTQGGFDPTIEKTYGCSGLQILDSMSETLGEDFGGHYKFGPSKSIIEAWMAGTYYVGPTFLETVEVPAGEIGGASSVNSLKSGTDYSLVATGVWTNAANVADAEYTSTDDWVNWVDGRAGFPDRNDLQVDNEFIDWGDYSPIHNYTTSYVGSDSLVSFRVFDGNSDTNTPNPGWYGDNSGSLFVDIIEDKWVALW